MNSQPALSGLQRLSALLLFVAASPALLLFISVPLSVPMQFLMGISMIVLMLLLNRFKSYGMTLVMVVMSVAVSTRYMYWRTTETLAFDNGVEAFFGAGLYLAEVWVWLILMLGYVQTIMPLKRPIEPLPEDTSAWPTVDVYIPTYNESLNVVQDTVLAALNIDYPADKLRVYILDDGRRSEFGAFAAAAGAGYITRSDNNHAKAGNLNNAMRRTDGELICIFDCDHVSTRAFLQATVGLFLKDPKLALVQTPHHFYSPDPFERNLSTGENVPNEGELFYGPIQQGNDYWNAAFFCGSCAVIRRTALEETNGFAVETVTEDAHTALKLQRMGWNTAFIAIPLAAGLATERLSLHIGQRMRWARGMTQILRRDNPLFGRGLKLTQRLCYLNAMLYYQFALPRIIFLTAPMAYLMLGQNVVASSAAAIFSYALPHLVHSLTTNGRIHGRHRYSFWGEIYETVLAFHILKPTLITLLAPKRGKFNVTDKGGLLSESFFDYRMVRPQIVTVALILLAIAIGLVRHFWVDWIPSDPNVLVLNISWATFSLIMLLAAIAVAMETRQLRTATRLEVKLPVILHFASGRTLQGVTRDISIGGVRITHTGNGRELPGVLEEIELTYEDRIVVLPAEIMSAEETQIRLRFSPLDISQRRNLVRLVMGRADAWLDDSPVQTDRPLRSFWGILKNALSVLRWTARRKKPSASRPAPIGLTAQTQSGKANPQLLLCLALFIICTTLASTLQAQEFKLPPLPPPVAVQGQGQGTPRNDYLTDPTAMLEVLRFEQMGIKDALTLRGAQAQAGLPFSISQQQIVSGARLDLHVQYTERLPSGTRLEVLLNGEQLSMIELISGTATDTVFDIPVNPLLLLPHNRLNLKLHAHAERCENPADSPLQVTVGKDSTVALGLQRLPLASDLSALPGPFFDEAQMGQLNLPVVMPANPSTTILRNAAIMTSYFGSLASYRGTRFPVWLDELPMGHAVVFAQAGETIAGLTLPAIDGPGLSIIDNPRDPLAKLLLVTGRTPAELRTATLNLVLRPAPLSGSSMQVAPVMVTPRRPYDAPRWIPNDRPVRFAELAQEPLLSESTSPALMKLGFRAAPDAFLWDGSNIPMQIRYRFPDGEWLDAPQSHLDLTLNGRYLGSLPVLKAGVLEKIRNHFGYATRQEQARLEIPPYLIFGDNQLDLFFNIQHAPDPTCALKLPDRALSLIDGESVIDLSHTQHFAQLPNLSFFVGAGFPFTRLADLAETGVVLPDMPEPGEIEAMLGLLGRFGESTGYPAVNVEIVKGSAQLAPLHRRDLLVVGRLDGRLDLAPLLAGSDYRLEGQALRVAQPQPLQQLRTLLQGDWNRQESAADRQLSGTGRFQGLLSRRSPFDPTRVVVMALATQEDWLPRMVQTLRTPAINAEIRGDLTYFESTEKASSFRVGPLFAYGNLPWPIHIRWLFSERPLLLMSLLLVSTVLVAAGLYPLLRAHAAQRLG